MNRYKEDWRRADTRTITLNSTYSDFDDFVSQSGIDPLIPEYRMVFDILYTTKGDTYTIENTSNYLTSKLKFIIEVEVDKYRKQNEIWDKLVDKLYGEYTEINTFSIGDRKEDIEDFDNYKDSRNTRQKTDNVLQKIKDIQNMKTPLESLINNISKQIFIPYQKTLLIEGEF